MSRVVSVLCVLLLLTGCQDSASPRVAGPVVPSGPVLPPVLLLQVIPPVVDHRRLRPKTTLLSFTLLYWSEMAAYQIGIWLGCLRWRTLRPLMPILRLNKLIVVQSNG